MTTSISANSFLLSILFVVLLGRGSEASLPKGYYDSAGYNSVAGWCFDPSNSLLQVQIQMYIDGSLVGSFPCTVYRPDVVKVYGIENSYTGFDINAAPYLDSKGYKSGGHRVDLYCIDPLNVDQRLYLGFKTAHSNCSGCMSQTNCLSACMAEFSGVTDAFCANPGSTNVRSCCACDFTDCYAGACQNGGTCIEGFSSFTCSCNQFFSGARCENVNKCTAGTSNCHQNATCTETTSSFNCTCKKGFVGDGVDCADLDECHLETRSCDLEASCTNSIGSYSCSCNPGFGGNGQNCTECEPNTYSSFGDCLPCPQHSTSPARSSSIQNCSCELGFISNPGHSLCEEVKCEAELVNGTSWPKTSQGQSVSLACPQSFAIFHESLPQPNLLSSRKCTLSSDGKSAFWGPASPICEPTCDLLGCQNEGFCFDKTICICSYTKGRYCEDKSLPTCADIQCLHGGECIPSSSSNQSATCDCTGTGSTGSRCQIDIDDCATGNNACYEGSTCYDLGPNKYICDCPPGMTGLHCQIDINDCVQEACKNGGRCTDAGLNSFSCNCTGTGYGGDFCQIPIPGDCRPTTSPCQNGGLCRVNQDDAGSCDCAGLGFSGDFCQAAIPGDCRLSSFFCHNEGRCQINEDGVARCNCTGTGYSGTTCQISTPGDCRVPSSFCLNDGLCLLFANDSTSCRCSGTGFTGTRCQTPIQGDCRTALYFCRNGGICKQRGEDQFSCDCDGTAYLGVTCETYVADCVANGCQNGGICNSNTRSCECVGNFDGIHCEKEKIACDASPCKNGGACVDTGVNRITCTCSSWRFIGSTCEVDVAALIGISAAIILVLCIYFLMRGIYSKAKNIIILSIALTLYDFITDCIFVYSQKGSPNRALFNAALAFLIIPVVFNLGVLVYVFSSSVLHDGAMERWLQKHYVPAAAVTVLAITSPEIFTVLQSRLFHSEWFSAPLSEKTTQNMVIFGLVGNLLEDIPQLVIQLTAAVDAIDTVVLLSIIASVLTIAFGIIKRALLFLIFHLGEGSRKERERKKKGERASFKTDSALGLTDFVTPTS